MALAGIVALVCALAWTWWRPSVQLERIVMPPRVIRGEPAEARLTVTNPGRRSIPPFRARDLVGARTIEVVKRLREMSPLYELAKEGVDLATMHWQTD